MNVPDRCLFCTHPEHGAMRPDGDHRDRCPESGCACCPDPGCWGHPTDKPEPRS